MIEHAIPIEDPTVHGAILMRALDMGLGHEDAIAINIIMLCEWEALSAMKGAR